MIYCPVCGKEIRFIARPPSSGNLEQPIAVDTVPEYLITESGRRIMGFREHFCPRKELAEGTISDSPNGK